MRPDILIKGGHVVDTLRGVSGVEDVGIVGNRIVDIKGQAIEGDAPGTRMNALQCVVDAKDCYVFPGLIDFHTHLFYGGSEYGVQPDLMLAQGVTTAVDAGTAGYCNYEAFRQTVIQKSTLRVRSFLSVYTAGLFDLTVHPNFDPALFNEKRIRELKERCGDEVLGLKIMLSAPIVGGNGLNFLKKTVELAEQIGNMRVCVHTTNPPVPQSEILNSLRPGDIFCHCYQGNGHTILDGKGALIPEVFAARSRGVVFDAANGISHFDNQVAAAALAQGFYPDIISSDSVIFALNRSIKSKSLSYILSKYLSLGLDLETVIGAATEAPARIMGMEGDIGTLRPGAYADVSVFKLVDAETPFLDYKNEVYRGSKLLIPQMTVKNGQIVFCQADFNNHL